MMGREAQAPRRRATTLRRGLGGCALASAVVFGLVGVATSALAEEEISESGRFERRPAIERWRDATPAERNEMRRRLRERMEKATPRQRRQVERRFRRLRAHLPDFSPIERLILMRAAARLPRQERRALRARIARIDDMEVAERRVLIADLRKMIDGHSEEVERLERNKDRWDRLSEADREEYRVQMERLRSMSLEERRALLEEMEKRGAGEGDR